MFQARAKSHGKVLFLSESIRQGRPPEIILMQLEVATDSYEAQRVLSLRSMFRVQVGSVPLGLQASTMWASSLGHIPSTLTLLFLMALYGPLMALLLLSKFQQEQINKLSQAASMRQER